MSLDVYLYENGEEVFWANVTHNLNCMASEAGVYGVIWRPGEHGIETAGQLIEPLSKGLATMATDADRFKEFNASNGWGTYDDFLPWLAKYLAACRRHPNASIRVSR